MSFSIYFSPYIKADYRNIMTNNLPLYRSAQYGVVFLTSLIALYTYATRREGDADSSTVGFDGILRSLGFFIVVNMWFGIFIAQIILMRRGIENSAVEGNLTAPTTAVPGAKKKEEAKYYVTEVADTFVKMILVAAALCFVAPLLHVFLRCEASHLAGLLMEVPSLTCALMLMMAKPRKNTIRTLRVVMAIAVIVYNCIMTFGDIWALTLREPYATRNVRGTWLQMSSRILTVLALEVLLPFLNAIQEKLSDMPDKVRACKSRIVKLRGLFLGVLTSSIASHVRSLSVSSQLVIRGHLRASFPFCT